MIKKSIVYSIVILVLFISGSIVFAQDNLKTKAIPPDSFKHCDIGGPAIAGTVKVSENDINMTTGGVDIWDVKDEFNFVYVERSGDFDHFTGSIPYLQDSEILLNLNSNDFTDPNHVY